MKYLFITSILLFSTFSYAQQNEGRTSNVAHYDSTYNGKPLGYGSKKFVGNLKGKTEYNFSKLWNQLTPENSGKWEKIGITPDTTTWDWEPVTNLYNYAKAHKMAFKFHTLIWGRQQPKWLSELSQEEQLKYITTWIRQVGQRFPDADMVDVVNEALPKHWPPDGRKETVNYINALGGNGKTGYDWVIKSFELARKYMPNAKLILNDFSIINSDSNTAKYLEIINLLKERKLIDGIGIQGHRGELVNQPVAYIKNNLDRLAATGIPIYMTEIDLGDENSATVVNDQTQLEDYQRVFPVLWEHPAVAGITFWGYVEGRMWKKNCYLVRADGTWRPAMIWLADYLGKNPR
jgi:endo-1,4-beta-xylanase